MPAKSKQAEKAKVAGQIKMQVLLECTKSMANRRGARQGEGGGRELKRTETELRQVQEMGE